MVFQGEIHPDAAIDLRRIGHSSDSARASAVGDCLHALHFWCVDGVPEGVEGRIVKVGVVLYASKYKEADLIFWFVTQGKRLRLLAVGALSEDERTDAVANVAIARI